MGPLIRRNRSAVALLAGATAVGLCAIALTGCTTPAAHPDALGASDGPYGTLPSYLPKSSLTPDSVLTGTASRPALTVEGDAVDVVLADGAHVRATVTGPVVPGEGLPFQPDATTATFQVTFESATASIPVSLDQFHAVDHLGGVYSLAAVPGEPGAPSSVERHQTVTFEVRAVMVTGEGILQWAPDSKNPVATWDFVVEND